MKITLSSNIVGRNLDDYIIPTMHAGSPELALKESEAVIDRTPVLTGALRDDVIGDFFTDVSSPLLVDIHSGVQNQLAEWNRVYVEYQEGGILGKPTYTNDPHEMYAQILTTDINTIADWALEQVVIALQKWTS